MRNIFREIWEDKRGNSLIIAAAALPLLLGSAGLATDTIQWALWKRQLQRAADSAAIAGVYDRYHNDGATTTTDDAVDHDLDLNNSLKDKVALVSGYPKVSFPADNTALKLTDQVTVELAVQRPLSFSSMFMTNAPVIKTSATAATVPGGDKYCVVSLEKGNKTGIQGSGNASVQTDCAWITNSISNNAAAGQGDAELWATAIAAAGGIAQSANWHVGRYDPYAPALDDPYADVNPDPSDVADKCGTGSLPAVAIPNGGGPNKPTTMTFNAGCYSGILVDSGETITLNPGIYYISGGNVLLHGALIAKDGVTIVLTNRDTSPTATIGSFDMQASATLDIEAPTTGDYSGIAIYQDRRATDKTVGGGNITSSSPNKINGNSSQKVVGALYFPNQQLTYNGGGSAAAQCTQFVVRRIVFTGNNKTEVNQFTADCADKGIKDIEAFRVRLVA